MYLIQSFVSDPLATERPAGPNSMWRSRFKSAFSSARLAARRPRENPLSNGWSTARPTALPPTTTPSKGGRAGKYSRSRCHRRSLSELPFSRQAAKVRSFKTHGAFADWQVAEKIHACPRSHTEKPVWPTVHPNNAHVSDSCGYWLAPGYRF